MKRPLGQELRAVLLEVSKVSDSLSECLCLLS